MLMLAFVKIETLDIPRLCFLQERLGWKAANRSPVLKFGNWIGPLHDTR